MQDGSGKDYYDKYGWQTFKIEGYGLMRDVQLFIDETTRIVADGKTVDPKATAAPGDVNADGVVDGRDVIRLMNYLADEIDPATGKVYEINENNADVDGSGVVDAKDLLRLVKYFGGEKVTLEKGKVAGK